MSRIKQVMEKLTEEEKKQLLYAFEQELPQYIKLPRNKFIGVNVDTIENLKVTGRAGSWAIGYLKKPVQDVEK